MKKSIQQFIVAGIILATLLLSVLLVLSVSYGWWGEVGFFFESVVIAASGGIVGGVLYMARGFYQAMAGRPTKFDFERFIWWYVFRPVVAAIAGVIMFIIFFLALDIEQTFKNQVAFFLVAFMVGYNFTAFMENKIQKIAENVMK